MLCLGASGDKDKTPIVSPLEQHRLHGAGGGRCTTNYLHGTYD